MIQGKTAHHLIINYMKLLGNYHLLLNKDLTLSNQIKITCFLSKMMKVSIMGLWNQELSKGQVFKYGLKLGTFWKGNILLYVKILGK
jgi:hypothetical protein